MAFVPDCNSVAETDLGAYRRNLERIAAYIGPRVTLMAVVKANAYGHGMVECARNALAAGANRLGVCFAAEGAALRDAGIDAPILVLGGESAEAVPLMLSHRLTIGVPSFHMLDAVKRELSARGGSCRIHVKVDTGMGRIGIEPAQTTELVRATVDAPGIEVEGIYSHFPSADEDSDDYTRGQIMSFAGLLENLAGHGLRPPVAHICNSAATLKFPEAHFDMVRPGIMTYGLEAYPGSREIAFEPVLSWRGRITFVKDVPAGFRVSYGGIFTTRRASRLATVPVGYAHGYRRHLSNRGEALVNGARVPVAGRICMDHTVFDVTDAGAVAPGDSIVFIGTQQSQRITVEELAEKVGTITHEIAAGITGRVSRSFKGDA